MKMLAKLERAKRLGREDRLLYETLEEREQRLKEERNRQRALARKKALEAILGEQDNNNSKSMEDSLMDFNDTWVFPRMQVEIMIMYIQGLATVAAQMCMLPGLFWYGVLGLASPIGFVFFVYWALRKPVDHARHDAACIGL